MQTASPRKIGNRLEAYGLKTHRGQDGRRYWSVHEVIQLLERLTAAELEKRGTNSESTAP